MHEFAICQDLLRLVLREVECARPPCRRLHAVHVTVGALRRIAPESLRFAWEVLTRDTPASGASLSLATAPVTAHCARCNRTEPIRNDHFACALCGATEIELVSGKDIILERLEIETDDAHGD